MYILYDSFHATLSGNTCVGEDHHLTFSIFDSFFEIEHSHEPLHGTVCCMSRLNQRFAKSPTSAIKSDGTKSEKQLSIGD